MARRLKFFLKIFLEKEIEKDYDMPFGNRDEIKFVPFSLHSREPQGIYLV